MLDWIKRHKVSLIFTVAIVLLAAAITVVVANYWVDSNPVTGDVQPTPAPSPTPTPTPEPASLTLQINGGSTATIYVGEDFTLSAVLSDAQQDVDVYFYEENGATDISLGLSKTDATGTATWTVTAPAEGSHEYYARADHP